MTEKLLTVTVPCYNSQAYMRKALDTLLTGGDALDIIVIDDGSRDDTGQTIRNSFSVHYLRICRVHSQDPMWEHRPLRVEDLDKSRCFARSCPYITTIVGSPQAEGADGFPEELGIAAFPYGAGGLRKVPPQRHFWQKNRPPYRRRGKTVV